MQQFFTVIQSPVGPIQLVCTATSLCGVLWPHQFISEEIDIREIAYHEQPILKQAAEQLTQYFALERKEFTIPVLQDGTNFQQLVWKYLQEIPYGATVTYGQLAKQLGDANASRAVGMANGKNKIAIIVPCHRVVGLKGTLTGFAGGLTTKEFLLNLESGKRLLF